MSHILFVGPVANTGGPAIKNRILLKYFENLTDIALWNTYNQSIKARLGAVFKILFSSEKYIIVAVSRKGRNLLYPFLLFRNWLNGTRFSCIVIGGQAVDSFNNNLSITAMRKADVVTVETIGQKKQMEDAFGLNNIHWMPNYKELSRNMNFNISEDKYNQEYLKIVFLSSMRNVKGVETLIKAYKKAKGIENKIVIDFYGPIKADFNKELLKIISDTEGLAYCGAVDNDYVLKTMSEYHVFAFPTEYKAEGFPAVLVEAQAVGLPVIASDINYNPEIIVDGINGLIFEHGNIDQLAEKLIFCAKNRSMLKKISMQNQKDAWNYDAELVINSYVNRLHEMGWPL